MLFLSSISKSRFSGVIDLRGVDDLLNELALLDGVELQDVPLSLKSLAPT